MFKINDTVLKLVLASLQISPHPQGFLCFALHSTAPSDNVAYGVHL